MYLASTIGLMSLRLVCGVNSSVPGVPRVLEMACKAAPKTVVFVPTREECGVATLVDAFLASRGYMVTILGPTATATEIEHEVYSRGDGLDPRTNIFVRLGGNGSAWQRRLNDDPDLAKLLLRIMRDLRIIDLANSLGWVALCRGYWSDDYEEDEDNLGFRFLDGLDEGLPFIGCAHCHGAKRDALLMAAPVELEPGAVILCAENDGLFTITDGMIEVVAEGPDTKLERILVLPGQQLSVATLRPRERIPLSRFLDNNWRPDLSP